MLSIVNGLAVGHSKCGMTGARNIGEIGRSICALVLALHSRDCNSQLPLHLVARQEGVERDPMQ